jgi:aminoglycoside phosphotransferase (APT) family kinase protein
VSTAGEGAAAAHTVDTPWRRDPAELRRRLQAWAAAIIEPGVEVLDVDAPQGTGMSSETLLFAISRNGAEPERYVARLAPDPSVVPVFPEYDLPLQRRCMELVRELTDVPAPATPWYEPDPAHLGAPFLVMERIDGVAPTDIPPYVFGGWLHDTTLEERAEIEAAAVGVLAGLHTITPERADLTFLDRPRHGATPLDQHLGYQRWYYDWAREGMRFPIIERLFEWLEARRPEPGPTVLNWGDARIGNILWHEHRPVAVLDWEMAALGPAEVDVAWISWMHRFFQDLAERFGVPGIPDFLGLDAVAHAYQSAGGRPPRDLEWYETFAALRHAVITVRTSGRGVAFGQMAAPDDPDDLIMFRHLLEQMVQR